MKGLEQVLKMNSDKLMKIQQNMETLGKMQRERDRKLLNRPPSLFNMEILWALALISAFQLVAMWFLLKKG